MNHAQCPFRDDSLLDTDGKSVLEKFKLLFENAPVPYQSLNYTGFIIDVNHAWLQLMRYEKKEEVIGKWFGDLLPESQQEKFREMFSKNRESNDTIHGVEFTLIRKDGSRFTADYTVRIGRDENGEFLRTHCVFQDVTEAKTAREEAIQNEQKLKTILDSTPFPVAVVDLDDNCIQYWSQSALLLFGHTASTSSEWYNLAYPDSEYREKTIRRWKSKLELARQSDRAINTGEYDVTCADGSIRTCELYAKFLDDRLIVTFNDITEKKQAEIALKESEKKQRNILDNASGAIFIKDLQGKYIFINKKFEEVHKITNTEIQGMTDYDLFPADLADQFRLNDQMVIKHGRPLNLEELVLYEDGIHTVISSKFLLNDLDGMPYGVCGIATDITERKEIEYALNESQRNLSVVFNNIRDLQVLWKVQPDGDLNLQNVNRTYIEKAQSYGFTFTSDDIAGISLKELLGILMLPDQEVQYTLSKYNQAMTEKQTVIYDDDLEFYGRKFYSENAVIPVVDDSGRCTYVIYSCHDITERKLAEEERQQLQSQLNQAQKMESIGRLAGGVAHDFNNKLSVILGYTEMALDMLTEDHPLFLDLSEIQQAANQSKEITRQLLAFARKQTITPVILNLNNTVKHMLMMLQRLIGEDIDLNWVPGDRLWPVKMDPSQLDQILANLGINARDAISGVGKITIETGNVVIDEGYCMDHPGFRAGEFVQLVVSDNGCGMDEQTQKNIFDPFFTTKDTSKGTGLGLATVYGIVKQNNGFINVYSELDYGTTFKIFLPRVVGRPQTYRSELKIQIPMGKGEKILIVEDDESILKMGRIMLTKLGYNVLAAQTPMAALELAQENIGTIALLITDVVMPEMNGRELANEIHANYPEIHVLFMSGYTANVIAHRNVLDEGVNFLQKPYSMNTLGIKIREILDSDQ